MGKIHYFLWPFSIATLVITRGYQVYQGIQPEPLCHPSLFRLMQVHFIDTGLNVPGVFVVQAPDIEEF